MSFTVAEDARPQFKLLLVAIGISLGLWIISLFLPITNYLFYPLQLFATFVHEGSHVLAAVVTGSQISSLTVSPDASGVVWSAPSGWFAGLLISSAGYLGTTIFGTLLLFWIRYGYSSRAALYFASAFIATMTGIFGLVFPVLNIFSANFSVGSVLFTVFSGALLAMALFAVAKYTNTDWANFALAFLSVQCLLNAFFGLKDLILITATTDMHTDAQNMAQATGIPSIMWVFIWIGISVVLLSVGLRVYVANKNAKQI